MNSFRRTWPAVALLPALSDPDDLEKMGILLDHLEG